MYTSKEHSSHTVAHGPSHTIEKIVTMHGCLIGGQYAHASGNLVRWGRFTRSFEIGLSSWLHTWM
jgi:hypothetical protein